MRREESKRKYNTQGIEKERLKRPDQVGAAGAEVEGEARVKVATETTTRTCLELFALVQKAILVRPTAEATNYKPAMSNVSSY